MEKFLEFFEAQTEAPEQTAYANSLNVHYQTFF